MKSPHTMIFTIVALVAIVGAYVVINDGSTMGEAIKVPGATCSDTDGGVKAYVKGIATISAGNGTNVLRQEVDTCVSSKKLIEYDCPPVKKLNAIRKMVLTCPNDYVCNDGACKRPADICTPKSCPSGACGAVDDGCGGTQDCGACCSPESDAAFCQRLNTACGSAMANDNCGSQRNVYCGGCASGYACSSGSCVPVSGGNTSGNHS